MPIRRLLKELEKTDIFRDIYSSVNGKWYKKYWKEFDQLKDIDQKLYCLDYHVSVNKYGVKCGTS